VIETRITNCFAGVFSASDNKTVTNVDVAAPRSIEPIVWNIEFESSIAAIEDLINSHSL
jgi:hypothetical protein